VGDEGPPWQRHPADAARLVLTLAALVIVLVVTALAPGTVTAVSDDIVRLLDNIPAAFQAFLVGVVQLLTVLALVAGLVLVVARRDWRFLVLASLGVAMAAVTMVLLNGWLADRVPPSTVERRQVDSWLTGSAFPSATAIASIAALLTVGAHRMDHRWRRATWGALGVIILCRFVTATEVPVNIAVLVLVGGAAGSVALLVVGAPIRPPLPDAEAVALIDPDLDPATVHVRIVGRDERDTSRVLGWWRAARVKGFGDQRPVRSPQREVENEALAMALAAAGGAVVPALVGVATNVEGNAVIAVERIDGRRLDLTTELTDADLDAMWRALLGLRRRRVAHGDLRVERFRQRGDELVLTAFGTARLHAGERPLDADVVNLLVSTATVAGVDRAVDAAVRTIDEHRLAAALPLVQDVILTPSVRRAAGAVDGLLGDVRRRGAERCGVEPVEPAAVKRVSLKGVVALVGGVVLGFYLLGLLTNWSDIWDQLRNADLSAIPWLVVLVVLTYVGGALSMMGSVVIELPFLRTTEVMFGQSFLNRFTPANAGGMAMRVRYLQVSGVEVAVGATAIGLTSLASGVVQGVFLVVFLVWGGSTSSLGSFELPDAGAIVIVVLAIAAVGGALVLSSWGRRTVLPRVRRVVVEVRSSLGDLIRRPDKLALLFGGAALSKLSTICAFYVSLQAFDVDMGFAQAGAVYMIANTIGSAVPTPGGVGGVEAALTAALVSAAVDPATAAAVVLLFRMATFWAPTVPGYFFMRHAQRTGIV
jgi:glycosyltransferase 2 family protein